MIRPEVRLDIFSDPVCPWCYIGMANLERALATHPDHPFAVRWHPFQLNPDMPAEGVAKRAYLEAKFGGKVRVDAIHDRLREIARGAGLDLDPDTPQRMPNTLDAHRLIHWAGIEGLESPIVGALMRAYWVEGRDIGDLETLADIAEETGMDRSATLRLLRSDADADDILARDQDARRKGVNAVPTFLVAQQYVVSGAQPVETWDKVIAELAGRSE
ncbi:MAG: DsbA family oxidoreductase [Pseudomonadota bacterium]